MSYALSHVTTSHANGESNIDEARSSSMTSIPIRTPAIADINLTNQSVIYENTESLAVCITCISIIAIEID